MAIYEQQLKPQIELDNSGKFLVINTETGEYEQENMKWMLMMLPPRNGPKRGSRMRRSSVCGLDMRRHTARQPPNCEAAIIVGTINVDRGAVLSLAVHGTDGTQKFEQEFEAVIDTGFNGYLTLSSTEVAGLNLAFHSQTMVMLGDSSTIELREFEAVLDGGHVKIDAVR